MVLKLGHGHVDDGTEWMVENYNDDKKILTLGGGMVKWSVKVNTKMIGKLVNGFITI